MKNTITVFGRKGMFFLCAIALVAGGLMLAGCPPGAGEDKKDGLQWPDAFADEASIGDEYEADWELNGLELNFMRYTSRPAQLKVSIVYYQLTGKSGDTYTVQQMESPYGMGDKLTGTAWKFTATVSGTTLTVSASEKTDIVPNGNYTKD
jgi:hypothetical protein